MKNKLQKIQTQIDLITYQFLSEQAQGREVLPLSKEASLEQQFGIDSLRKVELFRRIEKAFGIRFSDQVMAETDTLNDVAKAVLVALETAPSKKIKPIAVDISLEDLKVDLSKIYTLQETLVEYASKMPKRPHIYLRDELGNEEVITYGDLFDKACRIANGIKKAGIKLDETVAIMLPTSFEFFYSFFGVLLAGAIPVPIYPPFRMDRIEEYAIREVKILNNAQVRILITFSKAEILSKMLQTEVPSLKLVITAKTLLSHKSILPEVSGDSNRLALLQYTSGSTGDPKGILLRHKNIFANMMGIKKAIQITHTDKVVSWLPLYHDMGLMSWLNSLYFGMPITILSPLTFINHPEQWLWAIHYHRATLSAGPNFAYELCIKKIDEEAIDGLNLNSWRLAFNGAEAVNADTLKRFYHKFKRYGLKKETLFPVYGLAENTVALTFPDLNREARIDRIDRKLFEKEHHAKPTLKKESLEFVSVGKCIADHKIRIVNDHYEILPERHVGHIQFCGPSAMAGYHNTNATYAIYHDGWWDTGDLGYIAEGELFITGRKKDLIIKAGRNLYPEFIEEVVGNVPDIRKGCVIAFGVSDPEVGTEKMVIVAETKLIEKKRREKLLNEIIEKVSVSIGVPPDQIILVPPRSIPKTSSGKLQRLACKKAYLKNELVKKTNKPEWQMIKLFSKAMRHRISRFLNKLGRFFYSLYIWLMLITIVPVWPIALVIPRNKAAHLIKAWARFLFKVIFCPIKMNNFQELGIREPVIYTANHASFADALALLSVLPVGTLFVGKKELLKVPIISSIMKKLGFVTVNRLDFMQNLKDTQDMKSLLKQKKSLLIFPEGTFSYARGLRAFKLGAFQLAVDTQTNICPVAIKNSRKFLRSGTFLFSPTTITITLCPLLQPKGKDWQTVIELQDETIKQIVKYCGEASMSL